MPNETVPVLNPLTELDFIYVVQGCLDFVLDDVLSEKLANSKKNEMMTGFSFKDYHFKLIPSRHIHQSDLKPDQ